MNHSHERRVLLLLVTVWLCGCGEAWPWGGSRLMMESGPPIVAYRLGEERSEPAEDPGEIFPSIFAERGWTVRTSSRKLVLEGPNRKPTEITAEALGVRGGFWSAEIHGGDVVVISDRHAYVLDLRGRLRRRVDLPVGVVMPPDVAVDDQGRFYALVVDSGYYVMRGTAEGEWERWAPRPEIRSAGLGDGFAALNRVEFAAGRVHIFDVETAEFLSYAPEDGSRFRRRLPPELKQQLLDGLERREDDAGVMLIWPHLYLKRVLSEQLLLPTRYGALGEHHLVGILVDPADLSYRRLLADSVSVATSAFIMTRDMTVRGDSLVVLSQSATHYLALAEGSIRPDLQKLLPGLDSTASLDDMVGCYDLRWISFWGAKSWSEAPPMPWLPRPLEIRRHGDMFVAELPEELRDGRTSAVGRPGGSYLFDVEGDSVYARFDQYHGYGLMIARGQGNLAARVGSPYRYPSWVVMERTECPGPRTETRLRYRRDD